MNDSIFVSYPIHDKCEYRSISSLHASLQILGVKSNIYSSVGESLIQRARNDHMRKFLESDCNIFSSIDSDIEVAPDTFTHLYEDMKYCDFAGGLYPLKNGTGICSSVITKEQHPDNEHLYKAQWLSSGCWMFKREVVEKMIKSNPDMWYHSDYPDEGHKTYDLYSLAVIQNKDNGLRKLLSEDWAFCMRAQQSGADIYADDRIKLKHYGNCGYTLKTTNKPTNKFNCPPAGFDIDQNK